MRANCRETRRVTGMEMGVTDREQRERMKSEAAPRKSGVRGGSSHRAGGLQGAARKPGK